MYTKIVYRKEIAKNFVVKWNISTSSTFIKFPSFTLQTAKESGFLQGRYLKFSHSEVNLENYNNKEWFFFYTDLSKETEKCTYLCNLKVRNAMPRLLLAVRQMRLLCCNNAENQLSLLAVTQVRSFAKDTFSRLRELNLL